jgi:hypothetical protein
MTAMYHLVMMLKEWNLIFTSEIKIILYVTSDFSLNAAVVPTLAP